MLDLCSGSCCANLYAPFWWSTLFFLASGSASLPLVKAEAGISIRPGSIISRDTIEAKSTVPRLAQCIIHQPAHVPSSGPK